MNKKKDKIVLQPKKERKEINLALWLGVMAVPMIFGLLIGLNKNRPDDPVKPPRIEARPMSESGRGRGIGSLPMQSTERTVAVERQAAQQKAQGAETYKCDFSPWVGMKMQPDMLEALKGAGRPYRILKPGAMMTMDHNPARVNFDINEAGTITRIWCG